MPPPSKDAAAVRSKLTLKIHEKLKLREIPSCTPPHTGQIPSHTPLHTVSIPSHSNFHQYRLILNTRTLSSHADLHCIFPPHDTLSKMSNMAEPCCKIYYLTRVQKIPEKEALSIAEVSLRLQVFDRVLHVVSI